MRVGTSRPRSTEEYKSSRADYRQAHENWRRNHSHGRSKEDHQLPAGSHSNAARELAAGGADNLMVVLDADLADTNQDRHFKTLISDRHFAINGIARVDMMRQ